MYYGGTEREEKDKEVKNVFEEIMVEHLCTSKNLNELQRDLFQDIS